MNPRIKELAEQAGYLPDMFGVGHWDMPECKKFAELIILECDKFVTTNFNDCGMTLGYKMKKHFGVNDES
jgi:hypothetical protein